MLGNIFASFFWLLLAVHTISCRRYDVNEEAKKLYGEDMNSVLERFRRTPEYLKILSDQLQVLFKSNEAVRDRTLYVYELKLADRVAEEFTNDTVINKTKFFFRAESKKPTKIARFGSKILPINILDSYNIFQNPLTLNEKNRMKELAFEYVGRSIHATIEFLTPDNTLTMSTLLPYGGEQDDKATTIHHHQNHEITKSSTNIEPETETTFPTSRHSATNSGHHRKFGLPAYLK